jgi:hypothetical protein
MGRRPTRGVWGLGARRPGQVGEEAALFPGGDDGEPAAGGEGVGGSVAVDFGRPPAAENPVGQRMGGAVEGGGQGG